MKIKKYLKLGLILVFGLLSFKDVSKPKKHKKISSSVVFGIDVSTYQGNINWKKVKQDKHHIKFVIIRSTMGDNRRDGKFYTNVIGARAQGLIVGAYHYYDPNENSTKQANNYLNTVKLTKGDFIPIVDLEKLSNCQSTKKLKQGLLNWLKIVEKKYGVKPILYTGYDFCQKNLKEFEKYPLWIAAYSNKKRKTKIVKNSEIHQFSEKVYIIGIKGPVDGNDIKKTKLPSLRLKK